MIPNKQDPIMPFSGVETQKVGSDSDANSLRAMAEACNKKGREAYDNKDYSSAVDSFTGGIKVNCKDDNLRAELYTNRAAAHFHMGNYNDSLKDVKEATDIRPLSVKAILTGASASVKLNMFEQAILWCNAGIAMDKDNLTLLKLKKLAAACAEGVKSASETSTMDTDKTLNNLLSELELGEARETLEKDKESKGIAYDNLGSVYRSLGHFKKAVEFHQQALSIAKDFGNKDSVGKAYDNLGLAYLSLNDFNKAVEFHRLALSIAKKTGNKDSEELAYMNLGVAFYSLRDSCEADECFKRSPKLFEEIKDLLQEEDECKISPRDDSKVFNFLWRLQVRQGKAMEALVTADRSRAKAVTDSMKSRYGVKSTRSSPEEQMEAISSLLSHIPSPALFLAAENRSVNFWVLLRGQQCQFVRKELEDTLTSFCDKVYKEIGYSRKPTCEDRSMDKPEEPADVPPLYLLSRNQSNSEQAKTDALKALYDAVFSPISHLIEGEELIIVPDVSSLVIPYAALVDQHSRYLSETLRIRLAPSLTSLRLLVECPEGRHSTSGVLLVGNPSMAKVNFKDKTLYNLPGAEKEVNIIGSILNVKPLTGESAKKGVVLDRFPSAALIHIAAHNRKASGEIILCPNPSEFSRPDQEEYLVTIEEVMKLKLHAKLVVLSYSNSARGMIRDAEGVACMADAFLAAGARSVIASLWPINDKASVHFMTHFYEHLAKGNSASKSLNYAMTHMQEDPDSDYSSMKFWAPFVLIGDDVTFNFDL